MPCKEIKFHLSVCISKHIAKKRFIYIWKQIIKFCATDKRNQLKSIIQALTKGQMLIFFLIIRTNAGLLRAW